MPKAINEVLAEGRTPVDWLAFWAARQPDAVFMMSPEGASWQPTTWREAFAKTRALAGYLRRLGVVPGAKVGILAKNRPEWVVADLAIWTLGAVSVPIYPEITAERLDDILERAGIHYLFVDRADALSKTRCQGLKAIALDVPLDGVEAIEPWNWNTEALATITYTSGTTEQARGVMHSFSQITTATRGIVHERPLSNSRYLAYMSFAHVGERLIVEMLCLLLGGTIYLNRNIASLAGDLKKARPTTFVAVPRVWNQFKKAIDRAIPERRLRLLLAIPIVGHLVRRAIRKKLGLDQTSAIITGSAPSSIHVLRYFHALGVRIREGYALTENFGYSHRNFPANSRLGSVGQPLPGVRVRLDSDGEILVASPGNMLGYHGEAAATARAFDGEYLRTGDLGELDADGYLWITGRKKDVFKTEAGYAIHPAPLEAMLEANPLVERALVAGNSLLGPLALVQLNADAELSPAELFKELQALRAKINGQFDSHKGIRKIIVTSDGWAADARFVTPSQKIKRRELERKFEPFFLEWMGSPKAILWA